MRRQWVHGASHRRNSGFTCGYRQNELCVCLLLYSCAAAVGLNVEASNNSYIGPRFIMFGAPSVQSTSGWFADSTDADQMTQLWEKSEVLTGTKFVI
jgi:hypothetical protein